MFLHLIKKSNTLTTILVNYIVDLHKMLQMKFIKIHRYNLKFESVEVNQRIKINADANYHK